MDEMNDQRRITDSDLSAFVMGEGSAAEREAMERAIAGSGEVRGRYESFLATWRILEEYRAPEPPAGGLEDLHRRMAVVELGRGRRAARKLARHRRAAVAACAAVAVAVPIVIFGVGGGRAGGPAVVEAVRAAGPFASATPAGARGTGQLAAIPRRRSDSRRFLAGRDGNLRAGATLTVDSLAEWESGVVRVEHMDQVPPINLEDYAITNHEFEGVPAHVVRPDAVPVSLDPM